MERGRWIRAILTEITGWACWLPRWGDAVQVRGGGQDLIIKRFVNSKIVLGNIERELNT